MRTPAILLLFCATCAANVTQPAPPANPEELPGEFADGQFADWIEWSDAKNQWMREKFAACLKASGIRLSCGGCSAAVVRVIVQIDGEGRVSAAETYRSSVCGQPASLELERCMKAPLFERRFPALRGRRFRGMLGTGLSC